MKVHSQSIRLFSILILFILFFSVLAASAQGVKKRHAVPKEHPRVLGSRQYLQKLAKQRAQDYKRVKTAARADADDHSKMFSTALVCAVEKDRKLGRQAVGLAMKYINGPIRKGHCPFGSDMARCAIVYDLCHEYWEQKERDAFIEYMNKTVDANVKSESHVFHNGWYGYKHWGYGVACYASYYENPRAPLILKALENDYSKRAAPALEMAGSGGGWAEGYYINYWLYEWLIFCEAARRCEGADYYALAPGFYRNRALAGMFETYPGIRIYNSRRPIPMGDGGGRGFGGDRDKALSARRILVNFFRTDPVHQAVHTFNEMTPRSGVGVYAYKDFLWRDTSVKKGGLNRFRLSHFSPGPGYVYARSSWKDNAALFFFKCGDRFTAHQHLDVGHFLIYKHEELAGDGGHYDSFGTRHDVNYHLRTIAHNTILIHDPSEKWVGATSYKGGIRGGVVTGNDGGQMHSWPNHNGAVTDPPSWQKGKKQYDIADILAFQDTGSFLYTAGNCTRAYSPKKCRKFVRQIIFIRPGVFVVFDQVESTDAKFKKTWLLQAMKVPSGKAPNLVVTNGKGRLFIQTLLPQDPEVKLASGVKLYTYGGKNYPPKRNTGPAPECRIEISPSKPVKQDVFLHVLTATDSSVGTVPKATVKVTAAKVTVGVGQARILFEQGRVGGSITIGNKTTKLEAKIR
jgi:hypothetical protein